MARRKTIVAAVTIVAASVVTVGLAGPASATEILDTPDQVATAATQASAEVGASFEAASLSNTTEGFAATTGGSAPSTTSGDITFDTQMADPFKLSLPSEIVKSRGEHAAGNTVVYGAHEKAAVSVRLGKGVVQQVVTIKDASASHKYTFGLDSRITPVPQGDGSVALTARLKDVDPRVAASSTMVGVGTVAPAWAIDANGQRVPTHYEIRGNSIVQVIDFTADTAFPVIADPQYWYWWGYTVTTSWAQTLQLKQQVNSGALNYAPILCGIIGAAVATVACGVVMQAGVNAITSATNSAVSQRRCVREDVPFVGAPRVYVGACDGSSGGGGV
jgi:hypothetical protein